MGIAAATSGIIFDNKITESGNLVGFPLLQGRLNQIKDLFKDLGRFFFENPVFE